MKPAHVISSLTLLMALPAMTSQLRASDQEAEKILQRAVAAVGGAGRLETLKAPMQWMETGTYHGDGQPVPFIAQYASKWPNWYRQKIEGAYTVGIDGDTAFMSTAAGERMLTGDELKERLIQARVSWALFLFPLTGKDYTLSSIPGVEVNGRPTVGIKASHADGRDAKFFFDAQSHLIAKIESVVITPQTGPEPVKSESYYWDHQSFGGAMMPAKYKWVYDGKLFVEGETVAVKVHATVDPQWFSGTN